MSIMMCEEPLSLISFNWQTQLALSTLSCRIWRRSFFFLFVQTVEQGSFMRSRTRSGPYDSVYRMVTYSHRQWITRSMTARVTSLAGGCRFSWLVNFTGSCLSSQGASKEEIGWVLESDHSTARQGMRSELLMDLMSVRTELVPMPMMAKRPSCSSLQTSGKWS